jgi:hypothetical protein
MRTNLFSNSYEQPENKLTYSFLSLLEHLDINVSVKLLAASGIPEGPYGKLQVELLYGGGEANPDGSIMLKGPSHSATIFFENKTWRRRLDRNQIGRHISVHLKDSWQCHLLVVTTETGDRRDLDMFQDQRIHFMTWHQIAEITERLSQTETDSKDQFLLSQFQEYLETSGEAWRAKMLDSELLKTHAQFLSISPDESRFLKECSRLTDALREDTIALFASEIESAETANHWGRLGNECSLQKAPLAARGASPDS